MNKPDEGSIFSIVQGQIEARERSEGLSPLEFLELAPALRKVMLRLTRSPDLTAERLAQDLDMTEGEVRSLLDEMIEKGLVSTNEGADPLSFRVALARKRASQISDDLWSRLDERLK